MDAVILLSGKIIVAAFFSCVYGKIAKRLDFDVAEGLLLIATLLVVAGSITDASLYLTGRAFHLELISFSSTVVSYAPIFLALTVPGSIVVLRVDDRRH